MIDDQEKGAPSDCGGCSLHDTLAAPAAMERREFLRAATLALASLGLLGADARNANAMPLPAIGVISGRDGARAEEKHYAVPAADGVAIDRENSVIVARAAGKVYAFSLACPHRNTSLRWDAGDHQFMCPKHKSRYRDDGTFIDGRATRNMDRMAVRRAGTELIVDIDKLWQEDENPREWAAAFVPA
ncbi:MAG: Rieske [2Fe-2S] iron-sulfur protein [Gemmatimonadetes bacterium]|nr:Rieske [2Fe-2S] iron-sulfur protein [Gemmatimonadota bacterium]